MDAVGLITEYNPFHNGHLHHLRESLRATGAEVAVAVMSGHFLQRGEPALVDKWVRAEMALRAGVDVVVEIPFPFACNSAPFFARGAVQLLDAFGGAVTSLCFGSEAGEIDALQRCGELLVRHEIDIERGAAVLLREGFTFPAARARLVAELADAETAALLGDPNNILGLAYLRALDETGSPMRPFTIARRGPGFHDPRPGAAGMASATAIRRLLAAGEPADAYLPATAAAVLAAALAAGGRAHPEHFERLLLTRILRGAESLRGIYQVEDGLDRRLFEAAEQLAAGDDLAAAVKARHLTRTRIQRILCYLLNDVAAETMASFLETGPLYLRLLGASKRGQAFLGASRKRRALPLVTNLSRVYPQLKRFYGPDSRSYRLAEAMLACDLQATRLHTLLQEKWPNDGRNRDFYVEALRLPEE